MEGRTRYVSQTIAMSGLGDEVKTASLGTGTGIPKSNLPSCGLSWGSIFVQSLLGISTGVCDHLPTYSAFVAWNSFSIYVASLCSLFIYSAFGFDETLRRYMSLATL